MRCDREVNLYLVVLLTTLLHLAFAGSRVTLSLFAISLNASPFTVGVIISLLAALPMLFSVHAGRAIDRVGVRKPMLLGAGAVVAGTLLACALPRLETLFVVSALAGSGFILFHIAVNHIAGVIGRPEERARNFSVLTMGSSRAVPCLLDHGVGAFCRRRLRAKGLSSPRPRQNRNGRRPRSRAMAGRRMRVITSNAC